MGEVKGLTFDGLAAQIVSSIATWKKAGHGTINDCQVVVNHLIRKYHDRLLALGQIVVPCTTAAQTARERGDKTQREHIIPVACVMAELLKRDALISENFTDAIATTRDILDTTARLVWVDKDEAQMLKNAKVDNCMPPACGDYPWTNHLERYRVANISAFV
jgi:hypothetical protein